MERDILEVFAIRVRSRRKRLGWSQALLARKAGVHRTYLSSIEKAGRNVSLRNADKIAGALGVELNRLLR